MRTLIFSLVNARAVCLSLNYLLMHVAWVTCWRRWQRWHMARTRSPCVHTVRFILSLGALLLCKQLAGYLVWSLFKRIVSAFEGHTHWLDGSVGEWTNARYGSWWVLIRNLSLPRVLQPSPLTRNNWCRVCVHQSIRFYTLGVRENFVCNNIHNIICVYIMNIIYVWYCLGPPCMLCIHNFLFCRCHHSSMMLTQRISVLAHDFAKQCKVGGLKVEDKSRVTRSHSTGDVQSSQKSETRTCMYVYV